MRRIKAADFPRNDQAGYPQVGWDLDDDHKVSFGRDGDSDTWIVYLGLPGEHLYCEVDRDEIRNLGANVDARRRSLWSRR